MRIHFLIKGAQFWVQCEVHVPHLNPWSGAELLPCSSLTLSFSFVIPNFPLSPFFVDSIWYFSMAFCNNFLFWTMFASRVSSDSDLLPFFFVLTPSPFFSFSLWGSSSLTAPSLLSVPSLSSSAFPVLLSSTASGELDFDLTLFPCGPQQLITCY